jgi:VanZ family protein
VKLLKLTSLLIALLMITAIAWASLSGSPFMQSIPWIPDSIARWADQNPNFRNFPAFGLLAFTLFIAALLIRGKNIPLIRTALFCILITILLATLLELLQLALPSRSADWRDILWATLGALTATLVPAIILKLPRALRLQPKA